MEDSNQFQEAYTKEYVICDMWFHWLLYAPSPVEVAQAWLLSDLRLGQILTSNWVRPNSNWSDFKTVSQSGSGPLCNKRTGRNKAGCQTAQGRQNSQQQVEHEKLYSDLLQAEKREPVITLDSHQGGFKFLCLQYLGHSGHVHCNPWLLEQDLCRERVHCSAALLQRGLEIECKCSAVHHCHNKSPDAECLCTVLSHYTHSACALQNANTISTNMVAP